MRSGQGSCPILEWWMTNTTFPQTGWALWRSRESSRTQTTWSNRKCTIFLTFHLHKFTVLQFKWLYNYVSAFSKINIYQLNDIYTLQPASESARLCYKVKLQCTESATCPLELTSLPMQNLSTAPLSFRWPHFNFFWFIHHNAKTTRTCPHPFLLEKNLGASFSWFSFFWMVLESSEGLSYSQNENFSPPHLSPPVSFSLRCSSKPWAAGCCPWGGLQR